MPVRRGSRPSRSHHWRGANYGGKPFEVEDAIEHLADVHAFLTTSDVSIDELELGTTSRLFATRKRETYGP